MPITIPTVNISEFTRDVTKEDIKHTVSGDGIFDDMMETATKHLQAQFEGNRIRGEMYAQAYIQIYIETLRTAMQIWLQKPEQDAKVNLLNAQTEHTQAQTTLTNEQAALTHAQTLHEASKKLNTEADTALKGSQKLLIDSQKLLTDSQKTHEDAKKLLTDAQKSLVTAQATHEPAKKLNTDADTDLKKAQKTYITNQGNAAAKDKDLKIAQISSENMKTSLYKRQIEGYDENYKEKVLKIILDAFTVAFSVASDAWKGGLPKVMTVSGIDKICEPILKDINTAATNSNVETIRNMTSFTMPTSITNTSNFSKK